MYDSLPERPAPCAMCGAEDDYSHDDERHDWALEEWGERATVSPPRNWTPATIFDARDHRVVRRDGTTVRVQLHADGWSLAPYGEPRLVALDVWAACRYLNDAEAAAYDFGDGPFAPRA